MAPPPRAALLLLALVGLWPAAGAAQPSARLTGTVLEHASGAPLPGANVNLVGHPGGAATGRDGHFVIGGLEPGPYEVRVTFVGYETQRRELTLEAGEERELEVALRREDLAVGALTVRALSPSAPEPRPLAPADPSLDALGEMPSLFGEDLVRSLRRLPGVSTTSDLSTDLHVRGSSAGATLVRLDGATLFNPGHGLGLFSALNTEALGEVRLHTGAYPPRYGGRLGGVLQLETGSTAEEGFHGDLRGGLLAGRARLEGPHPAGSWMVAGRHSTIGPLLAEMNARNVEGLPRRFEFYDLNGQVEIDLGAEESKGDSKYGGDLTLSVFAAHDRMDLPVQRKLLFEVGYENRAATLASTHRFGSRLTAHLGFSGSRYRSEGQVLRTRVPFTRRVGVREGATFARFTYQPTARYEAAVGGRLRHRRYEVRDLHIGDLRLDRAPEAWHAGLFARGTYHPVSWAHLTLGARGHYRPQTRRWWIAPRARMGVELTRWLELELGAGRYYQFLTQTRKAALSAFDVWLPLPGGFQPARAEKAEAGLTADLTEDLRLELVGYGRRSRSLFRLDHRIPDATGLRYEQLFHRGSGRSFGGKASLRRRTGTVTGLLAYTYGRTLRRFEEINDGRYFLPAFDRRHDLNAVLHLNLPAGWQLTGAYRWAGSRPYTEPTGYYTLVDAPYQGHHHAAFVAPRNNARLPAYRRLDLGIGKRGSVTGTLEYEIRLQVLNVLGRRNPWFYTFQIDRTYAVHRFEMPQVPVPVPNLSMSLQF